MLSRRVIQSAMAYRRAPSTRALPARRQANRSPAPWSRGRAVALSQMAKLWLIITQHWSEKPWDFFSTSARESFFWTYANIVAVGCAVRVDLSFSSF